MCIVFSNFPLPNLMMLPFMINFKVFLLTSGSLMKKNTNSFYVVSVPYCARTLVDGGWLDRFFFFFFGLEHIFRD